MVLFRFFKWTIGANNNIGSTTYCNQIIIRAGSGSVDIQALRLDETQCPAGVAARNNNCKKARMALWQKMHDEKEITVLEMVSWYR